MRQSKLDQREHGQDVRPESLLDHTQVNVLDIGHKFLHGAKENVSLVEQLSRTNHLVLRVVDEHIQLAKLLHM